jgi:hypothetical protein
VDKEYKGMTERDLLVLLNERVGHLQRGFDANETRMDTLEKDFLMFKTELNTRFKTYTLIFSTVATAVGSVISLLINHFLR